MIWTRGCGRVLPFVWPTGLRDLASWANIASPLSIIRLIPDRPTSLSRYVMELLDAPKIEHQSSAFQILAHCPRLFIDSSNDGTLTSQLVSDGLIRGMTDPTTRLRPEWKRSRQSSRSWSVTAT